MPIALVQVTYNLLDTRAAPLIRYCQEQGIHVAAAGALVGGLFSERYLGAARPDTAGRAVAVEGGEPLAAALDAVQR